MMKLMHVSDKAYTQEYLFYHECNEGGGVWNKSLMHFVISRVTWNIEQSNKQKCGALFM